MARSLARVLFKDDRQHEICRAAWVRTRASFGSPCHASATRHTLEAGVSDRTNTSPLDATLRFATALVKDGQSGVTVILPREPGVLSRARGAASEAGVQVRADDVGSLTITMRFSGQTDDRQLEDGGPARRTTRGRCDVAFGGPEPFSGGRWRVSGLGVRALLVRLRRRR